MQGSVVAISGFLGMASDWSLLGEAVHLSTLKVSSFWEWADAFNEWAATLPSPRLLAGYSLGGRLALHALARKADIWNQAVIVSTHTGLEDAGRRELRLQEDLQWAGRFRSELWGPLMAAWNKRGALATSRPLMRDESEYSRETLARQLDLWSLGRQEDLKPVIENVDLPILWMAGEKDTAFAQIARQLNFRHQKSRVHIVPQAGHRLLHDNPQAIIKEWPWRL